MPVPDTAIYNVFFQTTLLNLHALLTSKSDKVQKISIVINDCKRLGIKVSPPNVNKSDIEFTALPENNEILFGLLAVKGLGDPKGISFEYGDGNVVTGL